MSSQSAHSGFSLLELMLTVSIATILMVVGVPSYKYVTNSNRVSGEINALLGDMQFARVEAVKEGLSVKICPAQNDTATTCNATTAWGGGWIVLSNAAATSGTAIVLRRQMPFANFNSSDTITATTQQSVVFNREGFATNVATPANFSLHDPTNNTAYIRCLIVGASGMLATAQNGATILTVTCS